MHTRPSSSLAAALSFLVPGLGQLALGRHRRGIAFAAPAALLLGMAIAALTLGRGTLLELVLQPGVILLLVVLNIAVLAYRAVAILDAWRIARASRTARERMTNRGRAP
jgi:hypothetical protein